MQQLEQLGFTCASCGKQFRWKPELAGKSVKCKCETTIRVPDAAGGVAQPKAARTGAAGVSPSSASAAAGKAPPPSFATGVAGAARAGEVPPRAAPTDRTSTRAPASPVTQSRQTRQAPPPPPPAAKPAPRQAPPPKAARAKTATTPDEDDGGMAGLYALAEQEAAGADAAADVDDATRCPNCRGFLAAEAVLCTSCGYDRRKGKVLSTATAAVTSDKPKRGLFGLGKPKKADPNKKQPVDKMAPQGSFAVGVGVSVVLAAVAGAVWFGVAYGTGLDLYFLVALVGAAAGVGMQIGQKGYSTVGGFAAVGVALAAILAARAAVVLAILMPLMSVGDDSGEDPRVVLALMGMEFIERGVDPEKTSVKKFNEIKEVAVRKAQDLTPEQKQAIIAAADAEGVDLAELESAGAEATSVFQLVVFGGVKPFLFLLAALGLAFRTANGGVSG